MNKKTKIIYLINHPPAYEEWGNLPKPEINFDTPEGSWVGIWGKDWAHFLLNEIIRITDDYTFEVWQPDKRADRTYNITFKNGLTHKSFPTKEIQTRTFFNSETEYYSESIIINLNKEAAQNEKVIFVTAFETSAQLKKLLSASSKNIFLVIHHLGNTITLLQRHHKSFIKNIYRLIEFNFINKEYLKLIKYFILSNEEGSDKLAELTKAKLFLDKHYPVGIDFNFWKSDATSEESRKILKIAGDKFVILSSSRLNGLKQIDKLIICLSKLRHRNYLCYISGHGTREYEAYLSKLITQHGLGENIKLIGYVETNELKNYYQSCNIFISVSSCEGGPTSPLYAMLLKKPVLVTKTGKTFEFMKRVSRGYTIPVDNITEWTEIIDKLIDKDELETIPLKEAIDFVDWDNIANFYNNTFKEILK